MFTIYRSQYTNFDDIHTPGPMWILVKYNGFCAETFLFYITIM